MGNCFCRSDRCVCLRLCGFILYLVRCVTAICGFRYELRMRYLPKGYLSHFSEDKPSLNYLYHQVSYGYRLALTRYPDCSDRCAVCFRGLVGCVVLAFTFTFLAFSRHFYPKWLTISTSADAKNLDFRWLEIYFKWVVGVGTCIWYGIRG